MSYVMFNSNIPLLIIISHNIRVVTFDHTAKQLAKSLSRILKLYSRGGFVEQTIIINEKF